MQQRNLKLLISLVVLTIASGGLFYFYNSDRSDIDKSTFKVADQENIDKVILESATSKVELNFDGSKWKVNGAYEADRQLVTVFFASLLQAEPKRKIDGSEQDSVQKRMAGKGVQVALWGGDAKVKEFTVCGNDQKTQTYFQLTGEEDIYFVTIPGYRVYVAGIFELNENGWRDKRIFNFNWQNFKKLRAHFPQQPNQDFTISLANSLFSIEEVAVADTTKLSSFLESVFNLRASQILTNQEKMDYDSLLGTPSIFQLEIEDISKHVLSLSIYGSKSGSQMLLGLAGNEEAVLLPAMAARSVMRGRDYFVLK
jgi:hypothetical protein